MEQDIVILSAKQWIMADEKTGEVRKGTTIWYVYDRQQSINFDGSCGDDPIKMTLPYEYLDTIKFHGGTPIHAKGIFVMRSKGNKSVTELQQIIFPDKTGNKTEK